MRSSVDAIMLERRESEERKMIGVQRSELETLKKDKQCPLSSLSLSRLSLAITMSALTEFNPSILSSSVADQRQEKAVSQEKEEQVLEESNNKDDESDADLILEANGRFQQDKLLEAARLLRRVQDTQLLTDEHYGILHQAQLTEASIADLESTNKHIVEESKSDNTSIKRWVEDIIVWNLF